MYHTNFNGLSVINNLNLTSYCPLMFMAYVVEDYFMFALSSMRAYFSKTKPQ